MKVHKNRQSRRVFVALLTTVIVAASLSGCGGENAKSSIPSGTAENVNDSFRIQLYPFVYQQIFAGQNNVEWIVDFQNGESSLVGHAEPLAEMMQKLVADEVILEGKWEDIFPTWFAA